MDEFSSNQFTAMLAAYESSGRKANEVASKSIQWVFYSKLGTEPKFCAEPNSAEPAEPVPACTDAPTHLRVTCTDPHLHHYLHQPRLLLDRRQAGTCNEPSIGEFYPQDVQCCQ
jgi:hypothetical protein